MIKNNIDKTCFEKKDIEINLEILNKMKEEKICNDFFFDNDFILINGECLSVMEWLINNNVVVNHILTDIPYGNVQGLKIEGWKNKGNIPDWDIPLDNEEMIKKCFYISKPNSNLLLFSQEPLTNKILNQLEEFQKYSLSNKMIWVKNNHANGFMAKTTPVNIYEEILLIRKSLDETNSVEIRKYFKNMLEYIGIPKKEIMNELGQGLDHCFRYANRTFYIPTEKNYNLLISKYNIDKMSGFIPYDELKNKWDKDNTIVFNIPNGEKLVRNVLTFKKDNNNIHPTQKPVELLEYLIKVFSNENDWILDFTSGSGSTGIACYKMKRKFIGIEINNDFYNKSIEWYKKEVSV